MRLSKELTVLLTLILLNDIIISKKFSEIKNKGVKNMLFGNPEKFAVLIEKVPEWESKPWINGIMFMFINWNMYPRELRNATLNCELSCLLDKKSSFVNPVRDDKLFNMSKEERFKIISDITYPPDFETDDDYKYLIDFTEMLDSGYSAFTVSNGEKIKIISGKWIGEQLIFEDETEIEINEYNNIIQKMISFYNDNFLGEG